MAHINDNQAILGGPHVPYAILLRWLEVNTNRPTAERESVAAAHTAYGEMTGIGNIIPFNQHMKETGWLTDGRWTKSYNPAGLGATNDGAWGGEFRTPASGIMAQYAHLIAYAVPPERYNANPVYRAFAYLDPRYEPLKRIGNLGKAPLWVQLNGRWAVPGTGYGESIILRANILLDRTPGNGLRFLEAA